jgi:Glu-tRNA(Gln) amidotransferase subunit E-like FAD-binding protein
MLDPGDVEWAWDSPLAVDAHSAVRGTSFAPLADALERGEFVAAVRLPGFGGLLAHATQPGMTFASEISERVRVIACLTSNPFMLGSHLADFGVPATAWKHLRGALKAEGESTDDLVIVWGPIDDVDTAVREILIRAADALDGVPSETRQPYPDGTTGFERILPGPQRMYPDTDTPPLPLPDDWAEDLRERGVTLPWDAEQSYVERGLSPEAARRLLDARWNALFDALAPGTETSARRLAAALEKRLVHHWRVTRHRALPDADRIAPLVRAVDVGEMRAEAFERAFDRLLDHPEQPTGDVLADYTHGEDDDAAFEKQVAATVAARGTVNSEDHGAILRWAMGHAMPTLIGKIDPTRVRDTLTKALELTP